MSQSADTSGATPTIEAPIGYLIDTGEMPVFYQSNVAGERTNFEGEREKRTMVVRDARALPNTFTLDVEGFAFVDHPTKVQDFYDDGELAAVYNLEVEALIAEHTGASRVFVFDHTRRSSSQAVREKHNARDPLALCDARSVDDSLLHTVERRAYNRVGQTRHASYDAGNIWYYFPRMTREEAVLIKNYDSAASQLGVAPYSLHTAFEDPTSPPDAAPRESLETRALVFFD